MRQKIAPHLYHPQHLFPPFWLEEGATHCYAVFGLVGVFTCLHDVCSSLCSLRGPWEVCSLNKGLCYSPSTWPLHYWPTASFVLFQTGFHMKEVSWLITAHIDICKKMCVSSQPNNSLPSFPGCTEKWWVDVVRWQGNWNGTPSLCLLSIASWSR